MVHSLNRIWVTFNEQNYLKWLSFGTGKAQLKWLFKEDWVFLWNNHRKAFCCYACSSENDQLATWIPFTHTWEVTGREETSNGKVKQADFTIPPYWFIFRSWKNKIHERLASEGPISLHQYFNTVARLVLEHGWVQCENTNARSTVFGNGRPQALLNKYTKETYWKCS